MVLPDGELASHRITATRVDVSGRRVGGDRIRLPRWQSAVSHLAGNLLVTNPGGFYEATPEGPRRLGTVLLVAAPQKVCPLLGLR